MAKVSVKLNMYEEYRKKFRMLINTEFFVGFRSSGKAGKKAGRDVTLLQVAIFNHFGTKNIPARPFLLALYTKRKLILKKQAETMKAIFIRKEPIEECLQRVANYLAKLTKDVMTEWKIPHNALSTIKQKGFDDPLIDTGKLRSAVEGWYIIHHGLDKKDQFYAR